jgi:hypothetical protein
MLHLRVSSPGNSAAETHILTAPRAHAGTSDLPGIDGDEAMVNFETLTYWQGTGGHLPTSMPWILVVAGGAVTGALAGSRSRHRRSVSSSNRAVRCGPGPVRVVREFVTEPLGR